jgi:hypothetical protein
VFGGIVTSTTTAPKYAGRGGAAMNEVERGWWYLVAFSSVSLLSFAAREVGIAIQGVELGAVFFFVPPVVMAIYLSEEGY